MGIFDEEAVDADEYLDANEEGSEEVEEEAVEEEASESSEEPTEELSAESTEPEAQNVPLHELLYERRRRQDMEKKLDDQGSNLALINQRLQESQQQDMARQQQARQQQEIAERPDEEEDPVGFANWRINQLETQLKGLGQMARQGVDLHRNLQAENHQANVIQQSQSMQSQFAQEQPAYWQAYEHLIGSRRQELQSMGYAGPQLEQIIDQEKSMIVENSILSNAQGQFAGWKQNPAKVVYDLALQRGFRAGDQPTQPQAAQRKMTQLSNGVRASNGAGDGRGDASAPASLENLAKMSDAEFERFRRQNPGLLESMLGA